MSTRTKHPELAQWLRTQQGWSNYAHMMAALHHTKQGWTLEELVRVQDFEAHTKHEAAKRAAEFSDRPKVETPEPGFYLLGEDIFRVQRNKADTNSYAKHWEPVVDDVPEADVTFHWRYVGHCPFEFLDASNRMTLAEAQAFGRQWGRCIVCDAPLKTEASVERGMGVLCWTKYA